MQLVQRTILSILFMACYTTISSLSIAGEAKSSPSIKHIIRMSDTLNFSGKALRKKPRPARVIKRTPNFHMDYYPVTEDLIRLDEKNGAIIGKTNIRGIPERYGIPDGTYYVWIGHLHNQQQAKLINLDASSAISVPIWVEPLSIREALKSSKDESMLHFGEDSRINKIISSQFRLPRPRPGPGPRPRPLPPPSYRWVTKTVCYFVPWPASMKRGKVRLAGRMRQEYRKVTVLVPDD